MEDGVDRGHHDDDLQHDSDCEHAHEDDTLEDALKDVVFVENLPGVDLVENLHEDERVEQQALAGDLVLLLDVVEESSWAVKCIENLQRRERCSLPPHLTTQNHIVLESKLQMQ